MIFILFYWNFVFLRKWGSIIAEYRCRRVRKSRFADVLDLKCSNWLREIRGSCWEPLLRGSATGIWHLAVPNFEILVWKKNTKIVFSSRILILKVLTFEKSVCDRYLHQTIKKVVKTKKMHQYSGHVSDILLDTFELKFWTRWRTCSQTCPGDWTRLNVSWTCSGTHSDTLNTSHNMSTNVSATARLDMFLWSSGTRSRHIAGHVQQEFLKFFSTFFGTVVKFGKCNW
jgi:hypothetical protein